MTSWVDVEDELPPANEVVDVSLRLTRGGATQLRGYHLPHRNNTEPLWLNALTHEPFPEGWHVVRWKRIEDASATGFAVMPTPDSIPKRA